MVDFTNIDLDQLFGFGDDSNPLMMLIWILPIILFIFYGQRIQLQVTSGEIKKGIKKLDSYRTEARIELIDYVKKNMNPKQDPTKKIDQFLEYFTIMPVDMDPNGIVEKVKHTVRAREDYSRNHVKSLSPETDEIKLSRVLTLLEIATSLHMIYKVINHMFLTAKKQNNYPLILPLQMILPFIMEEAEAIMKAIPAFKQGQPIGDGIGPMVVGKMMLDTKKEKVAFETISSEKDYEERKLVLLKAEGPGSTVGRPGDAVESLVSKSKPDIIIMVDAALKMEGEDSAITAQGFGAAIGGIGTERFQIEDVATKNNIPIFAIVIKQSVKEAITLMTKDIANQAENVRNQIDEMIKSNTVPGQTVLLIGVGNTIGVPQ
ncbi:MAG: DUF1512 domain-containing protein [Nitrosopumilaceae archaeon]|uniref:DUF1512 domain-containing protein n=3 Tax=Candidatus Nitrosomaritimum aestuariumsis TaxID=3342354 RepID=A0AC60W581_9ARCH|nr:DUF1512 domain-containing protein [Nitrosopumilaceae archaeon]MBA4454843.1 DUF1512 domain-containing protein [Nitrosopumilaceae archaeon]MBA4459970.1 DUF1512 domain-containing protein [Nitrosopumilaceae archaeon]MBA4461001.1 DUF1512 domain-containing protein [Nitrosopumilaceae archaeon]MBA4463667.1 DUF1512 domain-containing protein [Nitrosopumilaceae archaeon]